MNIPDVKDFELYNSRQEVRNEHDELVPEVIARFYKRANGTRTESMGIFMFRDKPVWTAWGFTDEEHCSMNAAYDYEGNVQPADSGCASIEVVKEEGKSTAFVVKTSRGNYTHQY